MSAKDIINAGNNEDLVGEPSPELYEGRIWVDGCFDFFHHGRLSIKDRVILHMLCI